MKKELEKDIQRAILDYLTMRCIFHYKHNNSGIMKPNGSYIPSQSVGAPDIVCIVKGRYVGLEVKRHDGKISDAQREFGSKIMDAGGCWFVVYSLDDVADVMETLIGRAPLTLAA